MNSSHGDKLECQEQSRQERLVHGAFSENEDFINN